MQQHSPKKKLQRLLCVLIFLFIHGQLIGVKQKHFQPYLYSSNNRHMPFQHRFLKEKTHIGDHLFFNIKELKLVKFKMF